jgi:hypothetical protein
MPKHRPDRSRESRITDEIIVDAYNSEERALSWYYYLEEQLGFPFKAKCIAPRATSPLKKGEEVEVVKMAREDDCMQRMLVLVRFAGRKLGVPLEQLDAIGVDEATREAIEDWRYWLEMGYQL